VLNPVGFNSSNKFTLQLEAPAGTYVIEASSDLTQWTPILTTNVSLAPVTITDPASSRTGNRFYRARIQ
jgi:hypothetical protein